MKAPAAAWAALHTAGVLVTRWRFWGFAAVAAAHATLLAGPTSLPMPLVYGLLGVQITVLLSLTVSR